MNESQSLPRSPVLMSRDDTALLVVDVQAKLIPVIDQPEPLIRNIEYLVRGAQILGVATAATEQYPQGLGETIEPLRDLLSDIPAKRTFSCRECGEIFEQFRQQGIFKILVVGIEAHVCIQQTVIDLLGAGFQVYVAVDAVASRSPLDCQIALKRIDSAGATLTTTEAALFEWCETAAAPEFKQISALVRERAK